MYKWKKQTIHYNIVWQWRLCSRQILLLAEKIYIHFNKTFSVPYGTSLSVNS